MKDLKKKKRRQDSFRKKGSRNKEAVLGQKLEWFVVFLSLGRQGVYHEDDLTNADQGNS